MGDQTKRAPRTPAPTLGEEVRARFASLERIRLSEMARLFRRGVPALGLSDPEFPARARVAWIDERPWFDFADEIEEDRPTEAVLIFVARDEIGEPVDLIAWEPKAGRLGEWMARSPVLGLETLWRPRLSLDGALPVFIDPWRWLIAGRDGLLLIDQQRALPILRDAGLLLAESIDFGERLLDLMTAKPPRILAITNATEARCG